MKGLNLNRAYNNESILRVIKISKDTNFINLDILELRPKKRQMSQFQKCPITF